MIGIKSSHFSQSGVYQDREWEYFVGHLPGGWEELACSSGALYGLRQDKDIENYLRVLLMHTGCGYSLRETVTRAREAGIAYFSDVALLKRLRKAGPWLHGLCRSVVEELNLLDCKPGYCENIRLIDATFINEPGKTGSCWRLHYSLCLSTLNCDHFEITPGAGAGNGEHLSRYSAAPGDHLLADRGYSTARGIFHIAGSGALITVRLNPHGVRLWDSNGKPVDLPAALKTLTQAHQCLELPVTLTDNQGANVTRGRLCALRKDAIAIARSQKELRQKASRQQRALGEEALHYAQYVLVFTTAGTEKYSTREILDLYRVRWQIELTFKRFKQHAAIGHLPKYDPVSARAWIYGKLFVALMTEKLMRYAQTNGGENESTESGNQLPRKTVNRKRIKKNVQPLEGV